MAKVLIADRQRFVRRALRDILDASGHEVQEATNGQEAIEIASRESINLVILDTDMPGMDGCQVLTKLKESQRTRETPVIMLTEDFSAAAESKVLRLGATDIFAKPFDHGILAMAIRLALRNSHATAEKALPGQVANEYAPASRSTPPIPPELIGTGGALIPLENVLSGGIRPGSLVLIEGASQAGKSVVCQYLTYGAIWGGRSVVHFSTQHTAESLVEQMGSIGLDLSQHVHGDNLVVYPLEAPSANEDPGNIFAELVTWIDGIPQGLIVVDSVSDRAAISADRAVMGFFSSCQRLCTKDRTIIVVAQSSSIDPQMLLRLQGLCNTHLKLASQMMRDKPVKTLEVSKVNDVEKQRDNRFTFQVEQEIGIRVLPMASMKG